MAESIATLEKELTEDERAQIFSYGFDRGLEEGYEQGYENGVKERSEKDFRAGFLAAVEKIFSSFYDFKNAIACSETFIKLFNEKFRDFSIFQARVGVNPASFTPTVFFVTNVPDELEDELYDLKRSVELEFMKKNPGHPVCVWSAQNYGLDENSVKMDFPLARKMA
jgi:hypothetical protein